MSKTGATGPPEEKVMELLPLPSGRTEATVPQWNNPRQSMDREQIISILRIFFLPIFPPG